MAVGVLGPLELGTATLSPRERAVLSALVLCHGQPVHPSTLATAAWGESLPSTWAQQVRSSVARIRATLGHGLVVTRGSLYVVDLAPDDIDAVRFEKLAARAREQMERGEPEPAVQTYTQALELWRGAAYPDLAGWAPAVTEAMRLEEVRSLVEEELVDAQLRSGRARTALPAAERLAREAPLREERWALFALALYRTDRQAEALAVVRRAREHLRAELGIDAGPRLSRLEVDILNQDSALASPSARSLAAFDGRCPYPGLRPFGPDDAEAFHGREDDADAVLARLQPASVVAISGASGCGKSSLLHAAVLPRLAADGCEITLIRPGRTQTSAVRAALARGRAHVLAVDQAEELFAAPPDAVASFCLLTQEWLSRGGRLVLTVRSDFLDRAVSLLHIGEPVGRGVYLLAPLTARALRRAIEEPAARAGLLLEPGLVELALRDAEGHSAVLPYLSHALYATWQARTGRTLTVAAYEAAGGIAGAIAQTAEAVYTDLDDDDGRRVCRSLLLRLVARAAEGAPVRRRGSISELFPDPTRRGVLESLIGARLVVADGDGVALTHEALATAWPRLKAWLDEAAHSDLVRASIVSGAESWVAGGRSEDDLLRGGRLHTALEWSEAETFDLTSAEEAFLRASEDHRRDEMRELAERARRERRQNRELRVALSAAAALLVIATIAGGFAVWP